MPRALGQIDTRKNEAILDAAAEVLAERGVHAPMDEVARRAGVSKQTIYNHYGSKTELVRTLVERRRSAITAPLEQPGAAEHPQATLRAYAQVLLEIIITPTSIQLLRMGISSAVEMPDLGAAIYDAGARASRQRLAAFLAGADKAELKIDDPDVASEVFAGMVTGPLQMRLLMGQPAGMDASQIPERARECAARFMRAYAPD